MNIKDRLLTTGMFIENEFLESYVKLVEENINNDKVKYVTSAHHVVPRYVYKRLGIDVNNSATNIVNLTFLDHMLAHFYLAKCASDETGFYSNACSLFYVLPNLDITDTELIERLIPLEEMETQRRKLQSQIQRGHEVSDSTRKKISQSNRLRFSKSNYRYMKKANIQTKVPLSLVEELQKEGWEQGVFYTHQAWNKGVPCSDEQKEKFSQAKKGRIWITHPELGDKQVLPDVAISMLLDGWTRGRGDKARKSISIGSFGKPSTFTSHTQESKQKIGKANSGGVYVYKDQVVRHVSLEQLDKFLSEGWQKGNPNNRSAGKYCWVTNGESTLRIELDQLQIYQSKGYIRGRKMV